MTRRALAWICFLAPGVANAQFDSTLTVERALAISGLYELADGRVAIIGDLVDQVGVHQLSLMEPESGRIRGLYAVGGDSVFTAGPAWFQRTPEMYRVRFTTRRDGAVDSLYWYEGATVVPGIRRHWRTAPVELTRDAVTLSGEIMMPEGSGPFPGLLMIPGSGPLTRRSPTFFAHLFVRAGFSVLVMDKRGTGASTGTWQGASVTTSVDDALAALSALRAHPDVDGSRIGIHAASEGGYVGPVVAARDGRIAFLICRVCAALPPGENIPDAEGNRLRGRGLPEDQVEEAVRYIRTQIDYALARISYEELASAFEQVKDSPWMAHYQIQLREPDHPFWATYRGALDVDPRQHYARMRAPLLVVLGEQDQLMDVPRQRAAFEAATGSSNLSLWILPGANHGLLLSEAGAVTRSVPRFHVEMAEWAAARVHR